MNAKDRSKMRAQRREQDRQNRREMRCDALGSADEIFSQHNLTENSIKSCKGVMWKATAQKTWMTPLESGYAASQRVHEDTIELHQLYCFTAKERGKDRYIAAPGIIDRSYYKTSGHYMLTCYETNLISTNSACVEGRGYLYSLEQWKEHARRHFKEYGLKGWYVRVDVHNFFPSIRHDILKKNHERYITDPEMRQKIEYIEDYYDDDVGLNLGMETSQAEAVMYLSGLDNYIKCQLHLKNYGHYMDDIYIFIPADRDPYEVLRIINRKLQGLGLTMNTKKTKVYPLTSFLPFCKATFKISETGAVTVRGSVASARKTRQKIRSFATKYKNGQMLGEDARLALSSSISYFDNYDNHKTQRELYALVKQEFGMDLDDVKAWRAHDLDTLVATGRITCEYARLLKQRGKTTAIYYNPLGSHKHKGRKHRKHSTETSTEQVTPTQLRLDL